MIIAPETVLSIGIPLFIFVAYLLYINGYLGKIPDQTNRTVTKNYAHMQNLTQKAEQGLLDPVIGRDDEIARVIHILLRKRKNNPILIGDPGVGKTAIAEGLALRIATSDVPKVLQNREILSVEVAHLLAGTKYRGEMEKRIRDLIEYATSSQGKVILFIDELHTLVQAQGAEGAVNPADIFKPALARGDIQVIGATTINEYNQYFSIDETLERRFQPVMVNEPTVDESIQILRGLKKSYETFHGVQFTDDALEKAVQWSREYIPGRKLPDKAIDIIDESAAMVKIATEENIDPAMQLLEGAIKEVKGQVTQLIDLKKDLKKIQQRVKKAKKEETLAKIRQAEILKIKEIEEFENSMETMHEEVPVVDVTAVRNVVAAWADINPKNIH